MATQLPPELLDTIIDHVVTRRDLRACALAGPRLTPHVRARRFRTVTINSQYKLTHALEIFPSVAEYVRMLKLEQDQFLPLQWHAASLAELLDSHSTALGRVGSLELVNVDAGDLHVLLPSLSLVQWNSGSLRRLVLRQCEFPAFYSLRAYVHAHRCLESIYLDNITWANLPQPISEQSPVLAHPFLPLREVTCRAKKRYSVSQHDWNVRTLSWIELASACAKENEGLQDVDVEVGWPDEARACSALLASGTARSIGLSLSHFEWPQDPIDPVSTAMNLSEQPNLQILTFSLSDHPKALLRAARMLTKLTAPRLHTLVLTGMSWPHFLPSERDADASPVAPWEPLIQALDQTRLPEFKTLNLRFWMFAGLHRDVDGSITVLPLVNNGAPAQDVALLVEANDIDADELDDDLLDEEERAAARRHDREESEFERQQEARHVEEGRRRQERAMARVRSGLQALTTRGATLNLESRQNEMSSLEREHGNHANAVAWAMANFMVQGAPA